MGSFRLFWKAGEGQWPGQLLRPTHGAWGTVEGSPKLPAAEEGVLGWIGLWLLVHWALLQQVGSGAEWTFQAWLRLSLCFLRRIWTKGAEEARQAPLAAPGLPAATFS